MEQIVVGIGDCRISDVPGQVLTILALGSCIGLAMYDHKKVLGGMLHCMLPESSLNPKRAAANPFLFADTAIPLLLERMFERGASRTGLTVYAAGGARMIPRARGFDIGKRNRVAVCEALNRAGVALSGEAVGGTTSRSLRLEVGTGRLTVQEGNSISENGLQRDAVRPLSWQA